jgi:flagellar hook-basal body complex protein FliE
MSATKITDYSKIIQNIEKDLSTNKIKGQKEQGKVDFSEVLKSALDDVSNVEKTAEEQIKQAITGDDANVHKTLIAVEKADLSFKLMMEIRNKLMDAYNEIMRIRV